MAACGARTLPTETTWGISKGFGTLLRIINLNDVGVCGGSHQLGDDLLDRCLILVA